jgi:hypothetical protein
MLPAWSIRNVRSRALRATLLGTTLTVVGACGGTSEPAVPPKDVIPTTITGTPTDSLRGVVGQINSVLTVTVKNKTGDPIDSAIVTFVVRPGRNATRQTPHQCVGTGHNHVDALGPNVGVQTVTATVGLPPVVFTGAATPSAPFNLAKLAGDAQSGTAGHERSIARP